MSILTGDLFFMFRLLILLIKKLEFLMCELLNLPKRENHILAKYFAMLWRIVPIPELIRRKGIPG